MKETVNLSEINGEHELKAYAISTIRDIVDTTETQQTTDTEHRGKPEEDETTHLDEELGYILENLAKQAQRNHSHVTAVEKKLDKVLNVLTEEREEQESGEDEQEQQLDTEQVEKQARELFKDADWISEGEKEEIEQEIQDATEELEEKIETEEKTSEEDEQYSTDENLFECPDCGEVLDVSEWSHHIKTSNNPHVEDHDSLMEYLKNDNGDYVLPHTGEEYSAYDTAYAKIRSTDLNLGEYIYEHREELGVSDLFDYPYGRDGNLKVRDRDRRHVSNHDIEQIADLAAGYMEETGEKHTQDDIEKQLFSRTYDTGTTGYNKVYRALRKDDRVKVDKESSLENKYYVEGGGSSSSSSKSEEDNKQVVEDAKDKLNGEHNYRLVMLAMSKMLPDEPGSVSEITYYGKEEDEESFIEYYAGNEELSTSDAWMKINTSGTVQKAITEIAPGEFNIKSVKKSGVESKEPEKNWMLEIERGGE